MKNASRKTLASLLFLFFAGSSFADTFDSDGVEIYYTDQGQGEPVVLVHGYTATGLNNWVNPGIAEKLSDSFRLIILDNPWSRSERQAPRSRCLWHADGR